MIYRDIHKNEETPGDLLLQHHTSCYIVTSFRVYVTES